MANKQQNQQQAERTERGYKIREVTHIQASWSEQERGEPGKFFLQLILDNGVEEYILETEEGVVDTMIKLFDRSKHTTFNLERKILIFGNVTVK